MKLCDQALQAAAFLDKKLKILVLVFFSFKFFFSLKYSLLWYFTQPWVSSNTNFIIFKKIFKKLFWLKTVEWIRNRTLSNFLEEL